MLRHAVRCTKVDDNNRGSRHHSPNRLHPSEVARYVVRYLYEAKITVLSRATWLPKSLAKDLQKRLGGEQVLRVQNCGIPAHRSDAMQTVHEQKIIAHSTPLCREGWQLAEMFCFGAGIQDESDFQHNLFQSLNP